MATKTTSHTGIGLLPLLQVAFIVLKLIGQIDWSWWWVLLPTWGPLALLLVVCGSLLAMAGIVGYLESKERM